MPVIKNKNDNFFKTWSPEMAYVLGFFVADGCMIKNSRGGHFIEFHITDKEILEKIKRALKSNHKISDRGKKQNNKNTYRLQLGSKTMFEDLSSIGMTPRKSKTVKLPKIPNEYFSDFVRGYFDGDGNVYAGEYERKNRKKKSITLLAGFTSGNKNFLEDIHQKLEQIANISGGSLHNRNGAYRLYYSVKNSCKLYKFMYNRESYLFLSRKKKIFESYFKKRNI